MSGELLFELCSVPVFPQKAQAAGIVPEPVILTTFDRNEELAWTATEGGWISSFKVPTMERYSSVHAHISRVMDMKSLPGIGLLSLSDTLIRLHSTGGLMYYSWQDEMADMTCVELDYTGHQAIIGRSSNKLSYLDISSGKIIGDMDTTVDTTCMCSHGMVVACGSTKGSIALRDYRTGLQASQTLQAHMGSIVSVDMHNDLLVSAGLVERHGSIVYDAVVKVYDIRSSARALTHIPFHAGCSMLHFQPKFSSTLLLMSNNGTVLVTDVNDNGKNSQSYQVDCEGDHLLSCAVSATGEAFAFGDGGGYVHLWAALDQPRVNNDSGPSETPEDYAPLCAMDSTSSLNAVPVFFTQDMPLSGLPSTQVMKVGMPPHKVVSAFQKNMNQVDFVGYVPNPEFRRGAAAGEATRKVAALRYTRQKGRVSAEAEFSREKQKAESMLPKGYHRVIIKQPTNRRNFEEFEFSLYNKTHFAGLENGMRNCYINSLIQVLYFLPWLRVEILKHICEHEFCLTCELGFLFHMLRIGAKSTVCQGSNLLRSLKQIREAAALGLLEDPHLDNIKGAKQSKPPLSRRIQNFSRFVLEQTMKEMGASAQCPPQTTAPAALFGSTVRTTTKCLHAQHAETTRESCSLHIDLQYPTDRNVPADLHPTFSKLLRQSLSQTSNTRGWCEPCRGYQPLKQSKSLCSLPDVLLINANITDSTDLFWWGVNPQLLGLQAGSTPPSSPNRWQSKSAPNSPLKPGKDKYKTRLHAMPTEVLEPWLPEVFGVQLDKKTGGIKVVEGTDVVAVQDAMGPADSSATCAVYELVALISHIQEGDMDEAEEKGMNPTELKKKRQERDEGHLVTHIRPHCVYYDHGTIQTPSKATPGISPLPLGKFVRRSLDRRANLSTKSQPASPPPLSAASKTEPKTPPTPANAGISSASKPEQWFLFNDFCVVPSDAREARQMYGKHKVPCLLFYHRIDLPMPKPLPHSNISNELFRKLTPDPLALNLPNPTFKPLHFHSEMPYHGQLLAIDAEFVSYAPAEKEVLEDGSELEVRPAQLGLARVSVVRGDSAPSHGACCMDDYVRTVEPVYDYLTRYSGLVHGDLDPAVSKHHITTLKHAYLKLRYLADSGCKFVGHGLKKDFRMANIVIPIENVVDTVEIFHFKRQRKLSLRFLSSYLLGLDIQQGTHDSIEDATVALALYKKYLELENAGTFQETLLAIYTYGKQFGWDLVKSKVAVPVQQ